MTQLEVCYDTLRTAAAAIDDLVWRAEEDFRKLDDAVSKLADGAPGTRTADAAQQFADRWRRQFRNRIDELEAFARNLRQAADNYCTFDLQSADQINQVPGGTWLSEHAVGGGYMSPTS